MGGAVARISDSERSVWRGLAISGRGLQGSAEWGIAASARSDGGTHGRREHIADLRQLVPSALEGLYRTVLDDLRSIGDAV